jgi:hypothetical protein
MESGHITVSHDEEAPHRLVSFHFGRRVANENTLSCFWRATHGNVHKEFENLPPFDHIDEWMTSTRT